MPSRLSDEDYLTNHPVRSGALGIGYAWLAVVLVIILGGLTTLALWLGGVIFAPYKGRAEAFKTQQSATNRIFAQQHFEQLYGDYTSTVNKLPQAQSDVAANPGDRYYQTNLTGLVNFCNDTVAQYDQDSQKYLDKDFKTADLPPTLDASTCTPAPVAIPTEGN